MFDNLSVHGMGGNVEGLFKGINQGQNELLNLSTLQTADVNRQNTLTRLAMEQELHPEKVKQEGLRTIGMGYENEAKKLGNQTKSREEQEAATGTYFRYLINGDDPEVAATKAGVPRTFVERTRQMQSELLPDQYQKFLDNAAKKWALSSPSAIQTEEADARRAQREKELKELDYKRGVALENLRQSGADRRAKIAADARMAAQKIAAELRQRPLTQDQYIAQLAQKRDEIINDPSIDSEAKTEMLRVLEQQINAAVTTKSMSGPQQQRLDLPAIANGGQIQMAPRQVPFAAPPMSPTPPGLPPATPGPQSQMTPQDQQALQWAQANQGNPKATAILQKLKAEGKI